jgi:hypothetical protein
MMCFSRPKSRIRVDDLIDGLVLQIMTMIERKSSARAKAHERCLENKLGPRLRLQSGALDYFLEFYGAHVRLVARALSVH